VSLQDLYAQYHERVQFLVIYIREAHPVDGWWLGKGPMGLALKLSRSKAATDVYDPQTIEERRAVAGRCEAAMKHGIRTYDVLFSLSRHSAAYHQIILGAKR
jgi:hypothetical protein